MSEVSKETEEVAAENTQEDAQEESQKSRSNPETKQIIEGLLLAAGKPLPINRIADVFTARERPEAEELKAALKEIQEDCASRGFELKQVASGYRFQVKQKYSDWVGKLWEEKPQRYSRALLETISIIAYRQPITRGEIEKIRGVAVSTNIIRTLMEREWVRVVGHRDVPGKPAMYATTREFLDYFNLKSLEELPTLSEIKELEDLEPELSLEDDAPESRVLEFPSAEDMEDEIDVPDEEEELAAAIGTRPIEEILGIREDEEDEEFDDDFDDYVDNDVDKDVDADVVNDVDDGDNAVVNEASGDQSESDESEESVGSFSDDDVVVAEVDAEVDAEEGAQDEARYASEDSVDAEISDVPEDDASQAQEPESDTGEAADEDPEQRPPE